MLDVGDERRAGTGSSATRRDRRADPASHRRRGMGRRRTGPRVPASGRRRNDREAGLAGTGTLESGPASNPVAERSLSNATPGSAPKGDALRGPSSTATWSGSDRPHTYGDRACPGPSPAPSSGRCAACREPRPAPPRPLATICWPAPQWIKNALVVAAAGAAGALGHDDVPGRVAWPPFAFCLLSAGLYALNDVRDVAEDRLHPRKRFRPVAAGELRAREACALGASGCWSRSRRCASPSRPLLALVGAGYVALTLSYTLVVAPQLSCSTSSPSPAASCCARWPAAWRLRSRCRAGSCWWSPPRRCSWRPASGSAELHANPASARRTAGRRACCARYTPRRPAGCCWRAAGGGAVRLLRVGV